MKSDDKATIEIPATTANLGPGYDCLGIALQIYSQVEVTICDKNNSTGQNHPEAEKMVKQAGQLFSQKIGEKEIHYRWQMRGDVPVCAGLGSSVILRLGILQGLNLLTKSQLSKNEIFKLCHELEGHPDNAAPGVFGGFICANQSSNFIKFDVEPELQFTIFTPDKNVLTEKARQILPKKIPHQEAVLNSTNVALTTAAFASKQYETLKFCNQDWLHQPYRLQMNPMFEEVYEIAIASGAYSSFISGSGPTICCISNGENASKITSAITQKIKHRYPDLKFKLQAISADNCGMRSCDLT